MARPSSYLRLFDAVLLIAAVATGWRFVAEHRGTGEPRIVPIRRGAVLPLGEVDWAAHARTAVLLVDTGCSACRGSIPFYRTLSAKLAAAGAPLVVIAQEARDTVAAWLHTNGIRVDRVLQVDAYALGFIVEPTLLLVDAGGRVTDLLTSKLSDAEEDLLWARLDGGGEALNLVHVAEEIDEAQLTRLRAREHPVVLNISERERFGAKHRAGSVNIPQQELSVRAPAELSPSATIVIDCVSEPLVACRAASRTLESAGFSRVVIATGP